MARQLEITTEIRWCPAQQGLQETRRPIFFCLSILACDLYRSWRRTFYPIILSAVRAVAARCKLPFALRPGLSEEDEVRTKENTKGIAKESNKWDAAIPYPSSADAIKEGVGRNSGRSSPTLIPL